MESLKPVVVFLSVFLIAAFVPLIEAQAYCGSVPAGEYETFPHEYDCTLYYSCYDGVETLHTCPDGRWYNEERHMCDLPENSGCINGHPPDSCVGVGLDYLPYPADCTYYIQCFEGESFLMHCPSGYFFDSISKMCTEPWLSDCFYHTTSPPWTTPDPICYGVRPGETKLFAYDADCQKYWKCVGATLTLEDCPFNFFFDEPRQLCDFPEVVECYYHTRTPNPWTSTPPPVTHPDHDDPRCQDGDISYWPHPVYCHMYIECYYGASYVVECPPGLYFDEYDKHCEPPSIAHCSLAPTEPPRTTVSMPPDYTGDPDCPYPQSEGWLLVYPGDCTKYFECAQGKKMPMDCPDGLYFSLPLQMCDYPYQTACPSG